MNAESRSESSTSRQGGHGRRIKMMPGLDPSAQFRIEVNQVVDGVIDEDKNTVELLDGRTVRIVGICSDDESDLGCVFTVEVVQ